MNYGSDPADQIIRYSLDGTEHLLRLSGSAAKNFAVFVAAVLKDQKKTHGKTRLVRLLRENKPLKFFSVPKESMRDFNYEANRRGLLYVPIRDRLDPDNIEIAVWADDAAKVNRVIDRLALDTVECGGAVSVGPQANEVNLGSKQGGLQRSPSPPERVRSANWRRLAPSSGGATYEETTPEQESISEQGNQNFEAPEQDTPAPTTKTVPTKAGEVQFEVNEDEQEFNMGFTPAADPEQELNSPQPAAAQQTTEPLPSTPPPTPAPKENANPSGRSLPNNPPFSAPCAGERRSVRAELHEIRRSLFPPKREPRAPELARPIKIKRKEQVL